MKPPTQKQAKDVALKVHARIITADRALGRFCRGPVCEAAKHNLWPQTACSEALQCAHVLSRTYDATSSDLRNAWCLCSAHHMVMDRRAPDLWAALVSKTYGFQHVRNLRRRIELARDETPLKLWRRRLFLMVAQADEYGLDLGGLPVRPIEWARTQ